MFVPTILYSAAFAAGALLPRAYNVPSANGFPSPDTQQLMDISSQAGGELPNSMLPTSLKNNSMTALQLIAFNELFETAYFSSLLDNITSGAMGYTESNGNSFDNKSALTNIFTAVRAQEELHALGALAILNSSNAFAPSPCNYTFPVNNLNDSIALAETFTALVLGVLQSASTIFANDGLPVAQLIGSIIGQEGEQNGYYRLVGGQVPSEAPFLTVVQPQFAWSALQMFVVSCPFPLSRINLPIFPPIMTNGTVVAVVPPEDQTLSFATDLSNSSAAMPYVGGNGTGLYMTYQSGQLLPISVPIQNATWDGSMLSYTATFPYSENVMNGFNHGALTTKMNFSSADAVPSSALAGPAVIQARGLPL